MRLLVLGGTVFLSQAVAVAAVARGHDVICACRGRSGAVPDGARLIEVDRATGPLPDPGHLDAVVDVARTPSWVRAAVTAYSKAHWVFVSTINVYADDAAAHGGPQTLLLREPLEVDVDAGDDPDAYGRMKVACEQAVQAGAASTTVVRPGLVVGPDDPTGRFAYWPRRLSRTTEAPEVLAPGDPADLVQVIDVRDLADWMVDLAERRHAGVYDAVGSPLAISDLLTQMAAGLDVTPAWTWIDDEGLAGLGVLPWAGPDAVPLWLPRPQYDGMLAHPVQPALDAGLALRPIGATVRDTLVWLDSRRDAAVTGISLAHEQELLSAWRGLADQAGDAPTADNDGTGS